MTKLWTLTLALSLVLIATSAAPSFAATTSAGVPYCSSQPGDNSSLRDQLKTELLVHRQTILAIDNWNGCLKAITVDEQGNSTIAYYDDTLSVIRQDH